MDWALRKKLIIWLLLILATVFSMVVVGGLTRLTESGLSIVEWKPVTGTLPPLGEVAWQAEFKKYQQSPQYQKINKGMSLEEFRGIFWLEYLHRLLGRVIGLLFLLPMVYFWIQHDLPKWLKWRLAGLFFLGGLQGAIGWYMVKSGLVNVPMVSPYRLALHLGTAFLLMGGLIWTALQLEEKQWNLSVPALLPRFAAILTGLIFLQVLMGALVAGLDAGLTYNTFPFMDGHFIPNGLYVIETGWRNHFENVAMVQFQHRIGAYAVALATVVFSALAWVKLGNGSIKARLHRNLLLLSAAMGIQIALGILTLLHHVPVALASKHQAMAAIMFCMQIWIWYDLRSLKRS